MNYVRGFAADFLGMGLMVHMIERYRSELTAFLVVYSEPGKVKLEDLRVFLAPCQELRTLRSSALDSNLALVMS